MNEVERQSSAYNGEQIEECDMETEDDLKLSVLDKNDGKVKLQVFLIINLYLFMFVSPSNSLSMNMLFSRKQAKHFQGEFLSFLYEHKFLHFMPYSKVSSCFCLIR